MPLMSNAAWSYSEVLGEHAAQGLGFHVESLAFRGATLAQMLEQAAKGVVIVADDAPVSSSAPTARPNSR